MLTSAGVHFICLDRNVRPKKGGFETGHRFLSCSINKNSLGAPGTELSNRISKHIFRSDFPVANFGLPFKTSCIVWKFSYGRTKIVLSFISQPKFPEVFGKW